MRVRILAAAGAAAMTMSAGAACGQVVSTPATARSAATSLVPPSAVAPSSLLPEATATKALPSTATEAAPSTGAVAAPTTGLAPSSPPSSPAGASSAPELGTTTVATLPGYSDMAAYGGVLYVMRVTEGPRPALSITADAHGGARTAVVLTGAIARYYQYLAAGPAGLYASSNVIGKFSHLPDEVVRIDPTTLKVTKRIVGRADGGPFVTPSAVYLQLSPSTLSRVDPVTLAVEASYSGLLDGDPPAPAGDVAEPLPSYGLTLGDGSLWLIHGDATGGRVMRFDPVSLQRLPGSWPVAPGQGGFLVGTPHGV